MEVYLLASLLYCLKCGLRIRQQLLALTPEYQHRQLCFQARKLPQGPQVPLRARQEAHVTMLGDPVGQGSKLPLSWRNLAPNEWLLLSRHLVHLTQYLEPSSATRC